MFGAYRIGANTPAAIFCPPAPSSVAQARDKVYGVYALAADTPGLVDSALAGSNFLTGQEQGSVLGYYKQGTDIGGTGPWVATPAFMRDEMVRVLGEAVSLGKDIADARGDACALPGDRMNFTQSGDSECAELNRFISNTWSPFLFELRGFVAKHRPWHARLWGALYTEIQEYRKRVIGLRTQAIALGVGVTAPAPTLPPEPALTQIGNTLKTILYFVVGGFIVWVLFNTLAPMFKGAA